MLPPFSEKHFQSLGQTDHTLRKEEDYQHQHRSKNKGLVLF
jgi:hypothetical protein